MIKVQSPLPEDEDRFSRGYYNTWNRNKPGITLNLNKAEGIALAKRLAGISDAVVENFTPRVMANWGLDYPNLKKMHLTDFKVRILDAKAGTAAKTRVLLESRDIKDEWSTVGVSENIIEASWQALVDSVEYKLLKDERTEKKGA